MDEYRNLLKSAEMSSGIPFPHGFIKGTNMNGQEAKESQTLAGPSKAAAKKGGRWRPILLLVVLIAVLVLAKVFNVGEKLGALRDWLVTLGPWGPLVFLLIYIVAVVAALPGAAITIAAGALFGSVLGVILVNIGATVGASLAFLIARYFAREGGGQLAFQK